MIAVFCFVLVLVVMLAFGLALVWLLDTCECLPLTVMLLLLGVAFAGLYWLSYGFQRLKDAPASPPAAGVTLEKGGQP